MEHPSCRVPVPVLDGLTAVGSLDGSAALLPQLPAPADQLFSHEVVNLEFLMLKDGGLETVTYLKETYFGGRRGVEVERQLWPWKVFGQGGG